MFLRFCKAGCYAVTKGRIFFSTSLFFCKANFRSVNLTSEVIFALYETFSDPVRVTGREMRVLKSLCRFKMCADVKDSLVVKSPFPVLTQD